MGTRMRARRGGEQWCAAPVAPLRKRAVTIALCAAASEALAQVWRRPTVKGFESLSDDVALQRLALCSRTDVSHACDASLELAQHLEARFQAGQYASLYQQATYTWRNTATCQRQATYARALLCRGRTVLLCGTAQMYSVPAPHRRPRALQCCVFADAVWFRTDSSDEPTRAVLESLWKVNSELRRATMYSVHRRSQQCFSANGRKRNFPLTEQH